MRSLSWALIQYWDWCPNHGKFGHKDRHDRGKMMWTGRRPAINQREAWTRSFPQKKLTLMTPRFWTLVSRTVRQWISGKSWKVSLPVRLGYLITAAPANQQSIQHSSAKAALMYSIQVKSIHYLVHSLLATDLFLRQFPEVFLNFNQYPVLTAEGRNSQGGLHEEPGGAYAPVHHLVSTVAVQSWHGPVPLSSCLLPFPWSARYRLLKAY